MKMSLYIFCYLCQKNAEVFQSYFLETIAKTADSLNAISNRLRLLLRHGTFFFINKQMRSRQTNQSANQHRYHSSTSPRDHT